MMKQYTLHYVDKYGNTVARDYFDSIEKADSFMDEMIETYKYHNEDKGLILYDDDGYMVRYYEPENDLIMTNERLIILLYNAISCLEEYGCDGEQIKADIGITEEEYEKVMKQ